MKHIKNTGRLQKKTAVILSLILILVIAGAFIAYAALRDTTGTVTETLEEAQVTCEVNGDYTVTNTSNIPVLIRVRVIVNKTEGGEIIPGETPAYTVGSDWTQRGSYLYYNGILTASGGSDPTTAPAIEITPQSDTTVTVLAEAIQAASDAAGEEWGAAYSNGSWS